MTTLREAKRLGIPTILLTQAVDSRFSQEAQVVIDVPRGGDSSRMPLHGTVLVCLEMIVLSVASTTPQKTVKSLKRINELHRAIGKSGGKRGIEKIIHQREGFRLHIKVSVCFYAK
jgi:DNA-binding MurR/RpiR family transcriptional regulator